MYGGSSDSLTMLYGLSTPSCRRVGEDDDVLAPRRTARARRSGWRCTNHRIEHAVVLDRPEGQGDGVLVQGVGRVIGQIHGVDPADRLGDPGALILHRPRHRDRVAAFGLLGGGDRCDGEIGLRRQDVDRPRLVVVAVQIVGIVGVDVDRQGVLEDRRVQVGPGRDVVGPRVEVRRAG